MGKLYFPQKPTLINIKGALFKKLDKDPNVIAELKYNGTRLVLQRLPGGGFEFWNREGSKLKYSPSEELSNNLKSLNWKGFTVLDGELLHTKVKATKHQIVLYDSIVIDGEEVIKKPFSERRNLLINHFNGEEFEKLFPTFQWSTGFQEVYDEFTKIDYIEGLVMKRLDAPAKLGTSASPVVATMWKVRKPTKNYRY